ncbi:MAG TPA: radical SAM protein, partial [Smithellaceae bacterium]|nr:radical SAM protein [Smithellaceae bacterium]
MKILFIHPPIVKPSEPPAGIGRLSTCLQAHSINYGIIDTNLEGLHNLLVQSAQTEQTGRWSRRACKNLEANLAALQSIRTYANLSR